MLRVVLAVLLFFPFIAYAQKKIDCRKLTSAELRVIDVETECQKETPAKVDVEKLKKLALTDGKRSLAEHMKDPDSVKFRNLITSESGSVLCGEVNAKNSYGGYVGFKRFYYFWSTSKPSSIFGEADFHEEFWIRSCQK